MKIVFVGVNGVRLSTPLTLTPVTNVASLPFHLVYHHLNYNVAISRVIDTGNLLCGGIGAARVLHVSSNRHPATVRLFNDIPTRLTRTTHVMRTDNTSVVSFGVNYPIPGVIGGNRNSTLVGGPRLTRSVLTTVIGTIGVPIAMGFHTN